MCAWQAHNHDVQREELARVSRSDPLTGCLNRRGFEERFAAELADAARHGLPFALVLLDLDQFKLVNDSHGHAAGDELLCWVVESATAVLRPRDALRPPGRRRVRDPRARCRRATTPSPSPTASARRSAPRISVTTGLACFPADGADRDELYQHADAELYATKHGAAARTAPGRRELSWAAALAHAVDARMAVPDEHSSAVAALRGSIGRGARAGPGPSSRCSASRRCCTTWARSRSPTGSSGSPARSRRRSTRRSSATRSRAPRSSQRVEGLEPIVPWVRHSHEHFDGSGYPDGLSGETIPPASRILLVADAYDAMTSDRPYRRAMSRDDARGGAQKELGHPVRPLLRGGVRARNEQRATGDERLRLRA